MMSMISVFYALFTGSEKRIEYKFMLITRNPKVMWEEPRRHPSKQTTLSPWARGPHLIYPPSTDPTHHPKRHPDPISRFATVNSPYRQTDRHMG